MFKNPYTSLAVLLVCMGLLLAAVFNTTARIHVGKGTIDFASDDDPFGPFVNSREDGFGQLVDDAVASDFDSDESYFDLGPIDPPGTLQDEIAVLDAVLLDIVTNPQLKTSRDFYGEPGAKSLAIEVDSPVARASWPKSYRPRVLGYDVHILAERRKRATTDPRLLGVRLDKLDLTKSYHGLFDGNVIMSLSNVGGRGPYRIMPIGGCFVFYVAERHGDGWKVSLRSSMDL